MGLPRHPDQLVFSGGGLRCFWQGGFMSVYGDVTQVAPSRVAGVSGGALAAAAFLSGNERRLLDEMSAAFDRQDSNIDLFHKGETGLTPHQTIYCDVVAAVLDDTAARKIADGPQFQILIGHPPSAHLPRLTGTAMAAAYEAELHLKSTPHFNWAERMGLTSTLVDANRAAREGKLCNLVCAAAVIPPIFEPPLWDGQPVIDGGMADQAPMPDPDKGETLVLLTRTYRNLPDIPHRHYVAPNDATPVDKIDFTDAQKLRETWEQGVADARASFPGEETTGQTGPARAAP